MIAEIVKDVQLLLFVLWLIAMFLILLLGQLIFKSHNPRNGVFHTTQGTVSFTQPREQCLSHNPGNGVFHTTQGTVSFTQPREQCLLQCQPRERFLSHNPGNSVFHKHCNACISKPCDNSSLAKRTL